MDNAVPDEVGMADVAIVEAEIEGFDLLDCDAAFIIRAASESVPALFQNNTDEIELYVEVHFARMILSYEYAFEEPGTVIGLD